MALERVFDKNTEKRFFVYDGLGTNRHLAPVEIASAVTATVAASAHATAGEARTAVTPTALLGGLYHLTRGGPGTGVNRQHTGH